MTIKIDGVHLKIGVLKQIQVEVESQIKTKALQKLNSDMWRTSEIEVIKEMMTRTVDMDAKHLMVIYDLIQLRRHKIKMINPYGFHRVCGYTERTDGKKLLKCKTLISYELNHCQMHEVISKASAASEDQECEFQ
jgi:hypothetical protein